jgi:hypothetical protein
MMLSTVAVHPPPLQRPIGPTMSVYLYGGLDISAAASLTGASASIIARRLSARGNMFSTIIVPTPASLSSLHSSQRARSNPLITMVMTRSDQIGIRYP